MGTQGVNGANQTQRAQLQAQIDAAYAKKDFAKLQEATTALLKFDAEHKTTETTVEHTDAQPLTPEQQEAKAAANQKALDEIAAMKQEASQIIDKYQSKRDDVAATDTQALRGQEKYSTKETASEEFNVTGSKARKIAKAARQNLEAMDNYDAVEKIFTNEDEYKAAVKQAKEDGTWDKDKPKYTLLDGKALDGAKTLYEKSKESVNNALKSYHTYEDRYLKSEEALKNPNLTEQERKDLESVKNKSMYVMMQAAKYVQRDYNASQMFNEDGTINKDAYQKTMLQYTGTDFKAGLDERKVLKGSAEVKNKTTKDMFEAAGLDVRKNYTGVMKAGAAALALGTGALTGLLGGGVVAQAVASATATATASATASATATATNHWTASNGEEFFDSVEASDFQSTTVTSTATKVSEAASRISKGEMALRGLAGAVLPAVIAAITVKDRGEKDAFNGASVQEILSQKAEVSGKSNKAIMDKILQTEITGDQNRDKEIKAAILQTAIGERTGKSANTRELLAAYEAVKFIKDNKDLIGEGEISTPPTSTPTDSTPTITEPEPEEDCYNVHEENIRSEVPVIKFGGPWHYSKLYVNADGTELSEADRRAVQKQLTSGNNAIQNARDDNGKLTGRAMMNEFTLPNGKTVKLADDAVDRAKGLKGKGGGKDKKYNTASDGTLMWATDCETGKPISPKLTPAQFDEWQRQRADNH